MMAEPESSRGPDVRQEGSLVSFPALVDRALPWALRGPWSIFWWAAVPIAAASAGGAILAIRASQLGGSDPLAGCGSLMMLFAFYPLAGLVWLICVSALTVSAFHRLAGRTISPGEAFAFVFEPRVALTLVTAAVSVVIAAMLSFFLLFLGGLTVALLFAFVVPVMIDRGTRGFAALAESGRLAWSNPSGRILGWPLVKLLGMVMLQFVMGAALQILVSLPYQIFVQVVSLRDLLAGQIPDPVSALGPLVWIQIPVQVLASLVQSWVIYYMAYVLGMFYLDLRARSAATDLAGEIDRLLYPRQEGAG